MWSLQHVQPSPCLPPEHTRPRPLRPCRLLLPQILSQPTQNDHLTTRLPRHVQQPRRQSIRFETIPVRAMDLAIQKNREGSELLICQLKDLDDAVKFLFKAGKLIYACVQMIIPGNSD